MAEIFLVCEGPASGLDARVLDAIVAQKLLVGVGSTRFRKPPGSTTVGVSWRRAEWLTALCEEARRVGADCGRVAALAAIEPAAIEARYDAIVEDVHRPDFIERGEYLAHMEGKELLGALVRELQALGAIGLSKEVLEDELVAALEREYQPGALFQPDDFASVRDRLLALGARAG